jgi:FtsH-binding integral membrane protein
MDQSSRVESVRSLTATDRQHFIAKTYTHLALALTAFVALEALLLRIPGVRDFASTMTSGRWSWLIVLGVFMFVSNMAHRWAQSSTSIPMQYGGLALYVVAQAIIFLPLLLFAGSYHPDVIVTAGLTTLGLFLGLSVVVHTTKFNASGMGGILTAISLGAFALIILSIVFTFSLGILFTVAMITLACAYIVYDTSNVIHRYNTNQYVAASLSLFASVALLLWYVVQFALSRE